MNESLVSVPHEIERRSFEIITEELGDVALDPSVEHIVKRVIHTTADFSYAESLAFVNDAVEKGVEALKQGATIVTDTTMALAGISKPALKILNSEAVCFIADEDVAKTAKEQGTTRAVASMEKATSIEGPVIFAIGNAPTALIRIGELHAAGKINPALVIGAPVGFVNVVESKEMLLKSGIPAIVARGRKGGSNVAAAICNALLYSLTRKEQ